MHVNDVKYIFNKYIDINLQEIWRITSNKIGLV